MLQSEVNYNSCETFATCADNNIALGHIGVIVRRKKEWHSDRMGHALCRCENIETKSLRPINNLTGCSQQSISHA